MEAEEVLKLFDSWWFENVILFRPRYEAPSSTAMLMLQKMDENKESKIPGGRNVRIRSLSDRCLGVNMSNCCKEEPKLQKILSAGKEEVEFSREDTGEEKVEKSGIKKECSRKKKGRKGMNRSLSALEIEELKGFMDLGFVFSEEEKNPGLISILPGLRKRGKMAHGDEGWSGKSNFMVDWEIPSLQNEIRMKYHLRIWAHTVASNVR